MKLFKDPTLWPRIRQATGTVYGDIGTSVLYTTMEMTRETILLKHHAAGGHSAAELVAQGGDLLTRSELLGSLSLVFWALIFLTIGKLLFHIKWADVDFLTWYLNFVCS